MPTAREIASETCPTCADLYRLHARNEAALRTAHRLYRAALGASTADSLSELAEELKQTTAARSVIGYTIQTHRIRQHGAAGIGWPAQRLAGYTRPDITSGGRSAARGRRAWARQKNTAAMPT